MKVLVIGGNGFIGKHLVKRLRSEKWCDTPWAVDKNTDGQTFVMNYDMASVTRSKEFFNTYGHFDIIFNLASTVGVTNVVKRPVECIGNELMVLHNISKWHGNVARIVYTSSSEVYENLPINNNGFSEKSAGVLLWMLSPYSLAKLLAEGYIQKHYPNSAILRLFNVYGAGQDPEKGITSRIFKTCKENDRIWLHNYGLDIRDFTYINDVVDILIKAAIDNRTILSNVGTGTETEIRSLGRYIYSLYDTPFDRISGIEMMDGYPVERENDYGIQRRFADVSKMKYYFHTQKMTVLADGLKKMKGELEK